MCGIAGLINFNIENLNHDPLKRMTESIVHRGPDDFGYFNDHNVAFGFRRLSILDTSMMGHQPMETNDGRYVIVYSAPTN